MKNLVVLVFSIITLYGCCDVQKEYTPEELWDCYEEKSWSQNKIQNAIEGDWEWTFISCFWTPENANDTSFANYTIHFSKDEYLEIRDEKNEVEFFSNYEIEENNDDLFSIKTSEYHSLIIGRIIVCENNLEFFDSYIDGCDNFYKKVE